VSNLTLAMGVTGASGGGSAVLVAGARQVAFGILTAAVTFGPGSLVGHALG